MQEIELIKLRVIIRNLWFWWNPLNLVLVNIALEYAKDSTSKCARGDHWETKGGGGHREMFSPRASGETWWRARGCVSPTAEGKSQYQILRFQLIRQDATRLSSLSPCFFFLSIIYRQGYIFLYPRRKFPPHISLSGPIISIACLPPLNFSFYSLVYKVFFKRLRVSISSIHCTKRNVNIQLWGILFQNLWRTGECVWVGHQ